MSAHTEALKQARHAMEMAIYGSEFKSIMGEEPAWHIKSMPSSAALTKCSEAIAAIDAALSLPDPSAAPVVPQWRDIELNDEQITAIAAQWGDSAERVLGNGSRAAYWEFQEDRMRHMVRAAIAAQQAGPAAPPALVMKKNFDWMGFYVAVDRARLLRGIDWKQVAGETGISRTTLSRMQSGRKPDAASIAALASWAGVNPAKCVRSPQQGEQSGQEGVQG